MTPPSACDVLIIGGGPVGLALLLQLRASGRDAWLVDARHAPGPRGATDPRAMALSAGSRQLLESLQAWPEAAATPIHTVLVSQSGSLGRLKLTREELGLPALGYVLTLGELLPALWQRSDAEAVLAGWKATALSTTQAYAAVTLKGDDSEHLVSCRLLVLADGGASGAALTGLAPTVKDYGQEAILARIRASHPMPHTAFERFAADGPLAVLPCHEGYALVWTQSGEAVGRRLQESPEQFCAELSARLGGRLGTLSLDGERHRFPLRLSLQQRRPLPRVVTLGNAAQALHPIAGQGLNLGLRDSHVLARLLSGARDSGETGLLAAYQRERRGDQLQTVGFTDGLVEGFRFPGVFARHARSAGLIGLDALRLPRRSVLNSLVFGRR